MDADRFDSLTRSLTAARTRRNLTRLLGGLTLGGALTALGLDAALAGTRIGGARCSEDRQCKTEKCLKNNTCSCSREVRECTQPSNPCKKAKCDFATKRCVTKPDATKNGTACGGGGTCQNGRCACPDETERCGGECLPPCPSDEFRNQVSCQCVPCREETPQGTPCTDDVQCCSNVCGRFTPGEPARACRVADCRAEGEACEGFFQCCAGSCAVNDAGTPVCTTF